MKKFLVVLLLIVTSVSYIMSDQIENIVLLDTSESMFPYYSGTIEYLIEDIVKQQLQSGDSFHLLSFNDFPEYEISRTIRGEVEIRAVLNRIFLLQPIGKYTDLISAFSYLYEYVEKLPSNSVDLIVTDPAYSGMNNKLQLGKGRIVGMGYSSPAENVRILPSGQGRP